MKEYLKTYRIELLTQGPVFIGSGSEISKKEYVREGKTIYIPDLAKLYGYISEKRRDREFQEFMLDESAKDLRRWMMNNKIPASDYVKWSDYQLDASDALGDGNQTLTIKTFIKDAYGCPYIPGSSLKGALRTILEAYIIERDWDSFAGNREDIQREMHRSKGKYYLQNENKQLGIQAFHSLERKKNDLKNAVNDIMSCIRVSDSQPLTTECLVLCKKIDVSVNGNENPINITRECIRPNTKVMFDLTVTEEFPFTIEEIREAISMFVKNYDKNFLSFFSKKGLKLPAPESNMLWLGGGVGYVSKTVMYPLFGYQRGLEIVSTIMQKTTEKQKDDKHKDDLANGLSPHMLKCTRCQGKLYEFGRCRITIL